jgi:uncharacterized protein YPO0396
VRITDRFVIKDKASEKAIRDLDRALETLEKGGTLAKEPFMDAHYLMLELLVTAFKRLDNNTTPARTLLDFTRPDVKDACMRVGQSNIFPDDVEYVIAIMQELTK